MATSLALDNRRALSDAKQRYKKEGEVIINSSEICLAQPAVGADARLVVKSLLPRADTANENHLKRSPQLQQLSHYRQSDTACPFIWNEEFPQEYHTRGIGEGYSTTSN